MKEGWGRMEIRVLKYFLTVAREESITRAADTLHITQPTLSRQLHDLENEAGALLFHRGSRRIELTQEGVLLRRRAEEIITLLDKTQQELANTNEVLEGCVTIGCGEMESVRFLAALMAGFGEIYPQVEFQIFTADADSVRERMDSGVVDMGLLLEPVNIEKYEYVRLHRQERWAAVLPAGSELAAKASVTARDLARETIILPRREKVQGELASWFGQAWKNLRTKYTSNLSTNASMLVYQHLGVALVLEGSLPFLDERELAVRPLCPELTATTVLAWKSYQPFSRAVIKFMEYVQEKLQSPV